MGSVIKENRFTTRNMELLMTRQTAIALTCILMVSGAFFMFGLLFIGAMESTKIDDLGHNPRDVVAFCLSMVMFLISMVGILCVTWETTIGSKKYYK